MFGTHIAWIMDFPSILSQIQKEHEFYSLLSPLPKTPKCPSRKTEIVSNQVTTLIKGDDDMNEIDFGKVINITKQCECYFTKWEKLDSIL